MAIEKECPEYSGLFYSMELKNIRLDIYLQKDSNGIFLPYGCKTVKNGIQDHWYEPIPKPINEIGRLFLQGFGYSKEIHNDDIFVIVDNEGKNIEFTGSFGSLGINHNGDIKCIFNPEP